MPKNRLANERSPYLRQHDHNPVDWYPWGDEALERARREDKPILLSVGYSACHWCHVMAHESFEDQAIAGQMNRDFISIKVDREERPDVDQLYQGVVQLMGQGGGWPLTVFLTPTLKPFFGGTYFPPADRYGRPGFPRLLEALADAWKNRRKEIDEQAAQFEEGLGQLSTYGLEAPASELKPEDVVQAGQALAHEVDRVNGGFGGAPKFPNPMNVALMLRAWRRSGEPELRDVTLLTLEQMAIAGIYDQLGGGFHRYSVDRYWRVPHFEKMLYDNAQLLHLYSEGQQVAPKPLFAKVVEETVGYLAREMTDAGGALYASQDADSEGEEGKFFVWTPEQVDHALPKELAAVAKAYFDVTPAGNFEHGQTVLEARRPMIDVAKALGRAPAEVAAQLAQAKQKLFELREQRVKPGRDDKILSGWNGLAIRGLAFAARVFRRPDWAEQARRAADFVLGKMLDGDRLLRSAGSQIDGFLEDYGDLSAGLVALYQATFEPKYLEAADRLARAAVTRFWDEQTHAYRVAAAGAKDLVVTPFALHDNAYPSGASSLTEAQVALAALTGDRAHLDQAAKYLEKLREPMLRNPFAYGHLWLAADAFLDGAPEVTLVMPSSGAGPWLDALAGTYAPTVALAQFESARVPKVLEGSSEGRVALNGQPSAYLCRNFACEPPVTSPQSLVEKLTPRSG